MKTVTIQIKKKQYACQVPEQFSELTPDQYIAYIEQVLLQSEPLDNREESKLYLLFLFLDHNGETLPVRAWNALVESGRAEDLFQLLDFLKEEQPVSGQWYMPRLNILDKWHRGPRSQFENMTFGEFIYADMIASSVNAEMDELEEQEKLVELAAILFRKHKRFNPEEVENRKPVMRWLKPGVLYAIFFNFLAVRQFITQIYTNLFKKQEENQNTESQEIELGQQNTNLGWLSIRRKIADDVLKLDMVDEKDLHDLFYALNEQVLEDKQKERK